PLREPLEHRAVDLIARRLGSPTTLGRSERLADGLLDQLGRVFLVVELLLDGEEHPLHRARWKLRRRGGRSGSAGAVRHGTPPAPATPCRYLARWSRRGRQSPSGRAMKSRQKLRTTHVGELGDGSLADSVSLRSERTTAPGGEAPPREALPAEGDVVGGCY